MNDKLDRQTPVAASAYSAPDLCAEDEINMLDLFLVLVKHRIMIAGVVIITGIISVVISLFMQNIYRSEATISVRPEDKGQSFSLPGALGGLGATVAGEFGLGGGGTLEKLEVVLKSRVLCARIIEKYDLIPVLFPEEKDADKKAWRIRMTNYKPPTIQDGCRVVHQDLLRINRDKKNNTITVRFDYPDPATAKKLADYYLTELSETLRESVLKESAENQHFFKEQLERTSDALLKEKIYNLLAREIEKETFALAQTYYGFMIIDPPIAPDMNKKIKPKRAMICLISVSAAFFVAVFFSFLLEAISKFRLEDPERFRALMDGLLFREKGR